MGEAHGVPHGEDVSVREALEILAQVDEPGLAGPVEFVFDDGVRSLGPFEEEECCDSETVCTDVTGSYAVEVEFLWVHNGEEMAKEVCKVVVFEETERRFFSLGVRAV